MNSHQILDTYSLEISFVSSVIWKQRNKGDGITVYGSYSIITLIIDGIQKYAQRKTTLFNATVTRVREPRDLSQICVSTLRIEQFRRCCSNWIFQFTDGRTKNGEKYVDACDRESARVRSEPMAYIARLQCQYVKNTRT